MEGRRQEPKSRTGAFLWGILLGLFIALIAAGLLIVYMIQHPEKTVARAMDLGMDKVVYRTLESLPREHIQKRQDDLADLAQRLVRAYARNRISPEDLDRLTREIFETASDQRVTPDEIDALIILAENMAGRE
jgi:hypothetical protein